MEGGGNNRGECADRSCAYVGVDTAQDERVKLHGVSEREECHDDI